MTPKRGDLAYVDDGIGLVLIRSVDTDKEGQIVRYHVASPTNPTLDTGSWEIAPERVIQVFAGGLVVAPDPQAAAEARLRV